MSAEEDQAPEPAVVDETAAGQHVDLVGTAADRAAASADREAAFADRELARADRRHAALDRQMLAAERETVRLGELVLDLHARADDDLRRQRRDAAAEQRDEAAEQRDAAAEQRDEAAVRRDVAAEQRAAFTRLQARLAEAEQQLHAALPDGDLSWTTLSRAEAALLREQEALDRLQELVDGSRPDQQARVDRAQAAIYLAYSALEHAHAIQARAAAGTDELTGVSRREAGLQRLAAELSRAQRRGAPLTVVFLDVDGLKALNDSRGHLAGDALLRTVGSALRTGLRSYDIVLRFGGDEFVCGLSDVTEAGAHHHVDAVLTELAAEGISLSAGWATCEPDDDVLSLVGRADEAMYRARQRRR